MKNTLTLLFAFLLIGTVVSCKKEGCMDATANNYDAEAKKDNGACTYDPIITIPKITTVNPYFITDSTAICGGNITSDGGAEILSTGLCWGLTAGVTVDDFTIESGSTSLSFDKQMTNLLENTTYYVKAYAVNSVGIAYGNEKSFATVDIVLPTVLTNSPVTIDLTTIGSGGNITDNGNGAILERGICWGTSPNPIISGSHTADNSTDIGSITSYVYNTQSEGTYYIRAYATNSAGTAYGQEEVYVNPYIAFIGELYQGGVVFYIDDFGHGLICSMDNLSSGAPWGCQVVTGATNTGLFSGAANTQLIVDACTTPGIAAVLCNNYSINGYSDWFLPNVQEFNKLYNNRNTFNPTLTSNGGTTIDLVSYWTSYESGANTAFKYLGSTLNVPKSDLNYVRAIRAF